MFLYHGETITFRKPHDGLILLFGRAEARCKFGWRKEGMKVGAAGIVKLLKKLCETLLVSQWQAKGETKLFVCGYAFLRFQLRHNLWNVSVQGLQTLTKNRGYAHYPEQHDCGRGNL